MKRAFYVSISVLFIISGYSCSQNLYEDTFITPEEEQNSYNEEEVDYSLLPPPGYWYARGFKETYYKYINDDRAFLIKGVAKELYEYGRHIKVIEDLKGNFKDSTFIFVWGAGFPSEESGYIQIENHKFGDFSLYNENDTLIIFLHRTTTEFPDYIEKIGDYGTIWNSPSLLQFSDGYVMGDINRIWLYERYSWKELRIELNTFLKKHERPSWWWLDKMYSPIPVLKLYQELFTSSRTSFYYFIKGMVIDSLYDNGKKIHLINDFEGNLPKETTTLNVWGGSPSKINSKYDDLSLYNNGDTLIMIISYLNYYDLYGTFHGYYNTISNAYSVLKLTNDSVNGYITSTYGKIETMAYNELQKLLNNLKNPEL